MQYLLATVPAVCARDQADLYAKLVPEIDPAIVILAHRAVDDPNDPIALLDQTSGQKVVGDAARAAVLRASITSVVHQLRSQGRKVVLIEPIPVAKATTNPETCLSKATYLEECRFVGRDAPTPEIRIYRQLAAADPGVVSIDFSHSVCPYLPICDPVVKGVVVRHDSNHLTVTFADTLLGPFRQDLVAHGLLK